MHKKPTLATHALCRSQASKDLLQQNLSATCNSTYQLHINRDTYLSIPAYYNYCLRKTTSDLIVFIHDDVNFHTDNWDEAIINAFDNNPKLSLIGLAGCKVYPNKPSAWWTYDPEENAIYNLIQNNKTGKSPKRMEQNCQSTITQCSAIDGFFNGNSKIRFWRILLERRFWTFPRLRPSFIPLHEILHQKASRRN